MFQDGVLFCVDSLLESRFPEARSEFGSPSLFSAEILVLRAAERVLIQTGSLPILVVLTKSIHGTGRVLVHAALHETITDILGDFKCSDRFVGVASVDALRGNGVRLATEMFCSHFE